MDWEFGISRCKLLYVYVCVCVCEYIYIYIYTHIYIYSRCIYMYYMWIKSKVLLYSIGNSIQYPVIKHNGKEYEKVYIYVYIYVTESLCCTAEINTTL